jgi:ribonuclease HIII
VCSLQGFGERKKESKSAVKDLTDEPDAKRPRTLDPSFFSGVAMIKSPVPECFTGDNKDEPAMIGVDEAGRGPVLGPMIYGAAYWPVALDAELSAKGFDDSKVLSDKVREGLLQKIKDQPEIGYVMRSLHAKEISAGMLRRTPVSLNVMAHNATIEVRGPPHECNFKTAATQSIQTERILP